MLPLSLSETFLTLRGFDNILGTPSLKMTSGFVDILGTSSAKISENNLLKFQIGLLQK